MMSLDNDANMTTQVMTTDGRNSSWVIISMSACVRREMKPYQCQILINGALVVIKDYQSDEMSIFISSSCVRACGCAYVGFLCVVQRWLQHQSSARLPGVTWVHRPEPGSGSQAVSVELQAAWRGSEDRSHDGGVCPALLSLQSRGVPEHRCITLCTGEFMLF